MCIVKTWANAWSVRHRMQEADCKCRWCGGMAPPVDGPDPFQLAAAGPGPVDLALQDYNTGLYRARWTGTVAGMYTINITLHSTPIFGSPVRVEIGAAPVSGRVSSASGVGLGAGG